MERVTGVWQREWGLTQRRKLEVDAASFMCRSVAKSCPTLCDSMDCSLSGFPVFRSVPEFAHTRVHWVLDAIQPSRPLSPPFSCPQSFPASGSLPMNWLFTLGGQSIGASASMSVLPMCIQGWFPLGLTYLLAAQGTHKSLLQHHSLKSSVLKDIDFFMTQFSQLYMTTGKTVYLTI